MKKLLFIFCFLFAGVGFSQMNFSIQSSFMHFFGGSSLKHIGGSAKLEYVFNDWAGIYGGLGLYSRDSYTGYVYGEAIGTATQPLIEEIPTPSSIYFTQAFLGTRFHFIGEVEPDLQGGIGAYGIVELGLLFGTSSSKFVGEGYRDLYVIPKDAIIDGTFANYYGAIGAGVEKPMGRILLNFDVKFNVKINEANPFEVYTHIPYGMSYFLGIRYPLSELY